MRQYLALALASMALAAPAPGPASTQTVPVSRRSLTFADGTLNELALMQSLQRTLLKYGHTGLVDLPEAFQKRDGANVGLTDQTSSDGEDELYYGPGQVGKAKFTFNFDTGSADVFVPGPKCDKTKGCVNSAKYDNSGKDQKKQTSVSYGSGDVSGEDYKDSVTVAGLTSKDQGFISLTDAQGFDSSTADGLIGMGFSTIAKTGYPTFFENLISQGSVKAKEFAFYLGRAQSGTKDRSALTLGGRDSSCYSGNVQEVPVTKKGYWQVALDGVKVNGQDVSSDAKGDAAIDTGTTLVLGPTKVVKEVMAKIPGTTPIPVQGGSNIALYAFPCNTDKKYVPKLTFGGQDFAINPIDFNLGKIDQQTSNFATLLGNTNTPKTASTGNSKAQDDLCIAGIGAADVDPNGNLYVVGDVFMKNWYTIFNYDGPSVGFAPATGNQ